jgi:hypothetical protein
MSYTPEQAAELIRDLYGEDLFKTSTRYFFNASMLAYVINAALEQQAKEASEAFAWLFKDHNGKWYMCDNERHRRNTAAAGYEMLPLFTSPPQPVSVKTALRKAAEIADYYSKDDRNNMADTIRDKILALIDKENEA